MEENALAIKTAIIAFFGFLTALWGWFGWLIVAWVALMALDWITGTVAGKQREGWSSKRAHEGLRSKGAMIAVVAVGGSADFLLGILADLIPGTPLDYTVLLCPLVLCWYIVTELGSILENAVELGAPCPKFLSNMLAVMESRINGAGDKITGEAEKEKPPDGGST